jgi:DNA-binding transcriptional ArsR family regulator
MISPDVLFRALADPLRRRLLDHLLEGERSVSELCALFPISQPAVSQHLKVLREAGLVHERYVGRRRIYGAEPAALLPVARWVGRYQAAWDARLARVHRSLRRARRR